MTHAAHEHELRLALAEGLVAPGEVAALDDEARRRSLSPLAVLVERGRLTPASYASLLDDATGDGPAGAREPTSPAFPIAGWDRYQSVRFLGQGGMGKVFLAIDTRLQREVAIKFVHGDEPDRVRRLIGEARAQARIDHERVCRVHEVGEVQGKVYIAMQYIAGEPLGRIVGALTLEQKVLVIHGVAEGLHAAHRVGFIHRDVKPANILVERSDTGELRPYVMDFGLARVARADGATLTGAVIGTPRYMAPEQARGRSGTLDRRADIYSLGATLYHIVTGEPPVIGDDVVEILHNAMTREIAPPRAHHPDLPADLEAIIMKCLERDRGARYDSARALADDLSRFLAGQPVAARPAGVWYRLRKRIVRQRRLFGVGAVLVALSLAMAGWGLAMRRASDARARLARQFTERVERIEAMARYSALAPAHDIRTDRAALQGQMAALALEVARAGDDAAGAGDYALGRGYLALDDDATARGHLEAAWQRGYREPRVAYALALALGHLYKAQLDVAARIDNDAARAARVRTIERAYREPALRYLAASTGAEVPSRHYVAALVAFYEGRFDDALRALDEVGDSLPWFYEAPALRGDILIARARRRGDPAQATRDLVAGRAAYLAAAAIGESVPAVHAALGELEYQAMLVELYGQGDIEPVFARALAAVGRARRLLPDHLPSLLLEASARRSLAEDRANHGQPAEDLIHGAIAAAALALTIAPARSDAQLELVKIYAQWGGLRQGENRDPAPQLTKAVEIANAVAESERDAEYYIHLGTAFTVWADYEDRVGRDALANRTRAIEALGRALERDDRYAMGWINLGINYYKRARRTRLTEFTDDPATALAAFERAQRLDPSHVVPYFYQGEVFALRARRARARGLDPRPDLARAIERYRAGSAVSPKTPHLYNGIGDARLQEIEAARDRGEEPSPLFEEARAAFVQAVAVAPGQGFGYDNLAELAYQRARTERARGGDGRSSARDALEQARRALARTPAHPTFWARLALAYVLDATIAVEQGRDPTRSLAEADLAIQRSLDQNPKELGALRARGEAHALGAQLSGADAARELEAAARAFDAALEIEPEDVDTLVARAELCRAQREPARGLAWVDHLLALHPGRREAQRLHQRLASAQRDITRSARR